jgi:hypothetical protein
MKALKSSIVVLLVLLSFVAVMAEESLLSVSCSKIFVEQGVKDPVNKVLICRSYPDCEIDFHDTTTIYHSTKYFPVPKRIEEKKHLIGKYVSSNNSIFVVYKTNFLGKEEINPGLLVFLIYLSVLILTTLCFLSAKFTILWKEKVREDVEINCTIIISGLLILGFLVSLAWNAKPV